MLFLEGEAQDMPVGRRMHVLPMCADTTVNLHSHYFCVRKGRLESIVEIAGRGMFRQGASRAAQLLIACASMARFAYAIPACNHSGI